MGVIESDWIAEMNGVQNGRAISSIQLQQAINEAFKGKKSPEQKQATVIIGALGVGKTRFARELCNDLPTDVRDGTIYIGHYEAGVAENLTSFTDAFYSAATSRDRLNVTKQFNPVLGDVVTHEIVKASNQGFSMVLDIDGTMEGDEFTIERLQSLGYEKISVAAIHTPFEIAEGRSEEKFWPTDALDLVEKRTDAFAALPRQAAAGSNFDFYTNNYIEQPARKIFTVRPSEVPLIFNADALQQVCEDLTQDIDPIKKHLKFLRKTSEYKNRVDIDRMIEEYAAAAQKAADFLREIQKEGEVAPEQAPKFRTLLKRSLAGPSRDR